MKGKALGKRRDERKKRERDGKKAKRKEKEKKEGEGKKEGERGKKLDASRGEVDRFVWSLDLKPTHCVPGSFSSILIPLGPPSVRPCPPSLSACRSILAANPPFRSFFPRALPATVPDMAVPRPSEIYI